MSKQTKSMAAMPPAVLSGIEQVGRNLKTARLSRGYTQAELAKLVYVSRDTIRRIEAGDPGVSLGVLASVLWIFQLDDQLNLLASPERDRLGQSMRRSSLPERARKGGVDDEHDF